MPENPDDRSTDGRRESPRSPSEFPSTRWSMLLTGPTPETLENLAREYWRPIHAYLGARGIRREDEATEVTQEFFAWILETGFVGRADPKRGKFRAFVKTALKNFLTDRDRRARAEKRGGGRAPSHLAGDESAHGVPEPADPDALRPEDQLDQSWRNELIARCVDTLRRELGEEGRGKQFEVFHEFYLGDSEPSYDVLCKRFGISKSEVSNWLMYVKRRYRETLRRIVLDTVSCKEELENELAWLLGGDAS